MMAEARGKGSLFTSWQGIKNETERYQGPAVFWKGIPPTPLI
jgi:hypothetical protein